MPDTYSYKGTEPTSGAINTGGTPTTGCPEPGSGSGVVVPDIKSYATTVPLSEYASIRQPLSGTLGL
ncbi:hypothetical protein D3C86_1983350 [compost metagenome]